MLNDLANYVLDFLNTARETLANKDAIADLPDELGELAAGVERHSFEVRTIREEGKHELEKVMLRLDNAFLRVERSLPAPKAAKKPK